VISKVMEPYRLNGAHQVRAGASFSADGVGTVACGIAVVVSPLAEVEPAQ